MARCGTATSPLLTGFRVRHIARPSLLETFRAPSHRQQPLIGTKLFALAWSSLCRAVVPDRPRRWSPPRSVSRFPVVLVVPSADVPLDPWREHSSGGWRRSTEVSRALMMRLLLLLSWEWPRVLGHLRCRAQLPVSGPRGYSSSGGGSSASGSSTPMSASSLERSPIRRASATPRAAPQTMMPAGTARSSSG